MKRIFLVGFITILAISLNAQSYVMSGLDGQSIEACSGTFTLGSYSAGQTFTMTACSSDQLNRHVTLFISSYSFPVNTSLCIYDGSSTSAPLLICYDSSTVGGTIAVQASNMNESGCLTFVFTGTSTGASWAGTFSCNFVCQQRQVNIVSTLPEIQDDGYINICWDEDAGESMPVEFTAQGTYPSTAYTCNDATNTFFWDFQDGSPVVSGLGMTTVTHTFLSRQGQNVTVIIEDSQGCVNNNHVVQRVRGSLPPVFNQANTGLNQEQICLGAPVTACAEFSPNSWTRDCVPVIGDTMPIPDNPPLCIENRIQIDCYEAGQTLNSIDDLIAIHMNMAHTYLGDLTFYIQCPNGQEVQMGIQGGGGCNLGNPPSEGYWYNITPTATITMQNAASAQTTLPAGNYASYGNLVGLLGCPLNGLWNIRICDNWAADAGTIFGWWIEFGNSIYPDNWEYTQTYSEINWFGSYGSSFTGSVNENCATGTYLTTTQDDVDTEQPFILNVTDNFGCVYDTALYVTVLASNSPECCVSSSTSAGQDAVVCGLDFQLNATGVSGNNGLWYMVDGPGEAVFSDFEDPNSGVTVFSFGNYNFSWAEVYMECLTVDTMSVIFYSLPEPPVCPQDQILYTSDPVVLTGAMPDNGTYYGAGVIDNVLYPSEAYGNYEITYVITDANSCENSCVFNIDIISGIFGDSNTIFSIFPNPNNGRFTIKYENLPEDLKCEIINLTGSVVYSCNLLRGNVFCEDINIDVTPGIYFIKVSDSEKSVVEKIVIQ